MNVDWQPESREDNADRRREIQMGVMDGTAVPSSETALGCDACSDSGNS